MPQGSKSKAIANREQAVCVRLRQCREALKLSQEEFAAQVGISRGRLASYEEKRAPLRADLGLRICHQFILSEEWLATGKGSMRACLDLLLDPMVHHLPVDAPFGEIYDNHLASLVSKIRQQVGGDLRVLPQPGDSYERMENLLLFCLFRWLREYPTTAKLPEQFGSALCACLIARGHDFTEFSVGNGKLPESGEELENWLTAQSNKAARVSRAARDKFLLQMQHRLRDTQNIIEETLRHTPAKN